jgi:lipoyl(octanoyl) transferase
VRASPGTCQPWTVRVDAGADGPTNMAADHALVRAAGGGEAFLRLYRWDPPTLSLGRNEPGRGRYDPEKARERGIGIVRRPTGGRAVLHAREVTYAVAAPIRCFGGLREAYRAINQALLSGLARLGVGVALAGEGDPPSSREGRELDRGACFLDPAPGEIVVQGRKLAGSAQVRLGDALLQHGSILLEDDQGLIERLRTGWPGGKTSPPAAATLADLLGESPDWRAVCRAVIDGFRETFEGAWMATQAPLDLPSDLLERYRSAEWTWRL